MIGLRMATIQKHLRDAIELIEKECDINANMSIKEARKHVLTAEMWVQREIVQQEAKHENTETGG